MRETDNLRTYAHTFIHTLCPEQGCRVFIQNSTHEETTRRDNPEDRNTAAVT